MLSPNSQVSIFCVSCCLLFASSAIANKTTNQQIISKVSTTTRGPSPGLKQQQQLQTNHTTRRALVTGGESSSKINDKLEEEQQQELHSTSTTIRGKSDTSRDEADKREHVPTDQHHRLPPTTANVRQRRKFKLPSWFNFNLYKQFYGKHYPDRLRNEIHKRIYLKTALQVFEQRALYRAARVDSLTSMNELSDQTSEELEAFRARNEVKFANGTQLPDCCNYDQVYEQIIQMLNKTTAPNSSDLPLSKALLDELEQKALLEYEEDTPAGETVTTNVELDVDGGSSKNQPTKSPTIKFYRMQQDETTAHPADSHSDSIEQRRESSAKIEVPFELEESIRRQVAEQLAANSPIATRLNAQLSAYFGEPVAVRPPTPKPSGQNSSNKSASPNKKT